MESEQLLNPQFSKESDPNNENIPLHRQRKRGMYSSMLWSYVVCLHIFVFLAFTLMGISYGVLRSTQIPAISVWRPLSVGTRVSNEHSVDHKKYSKFSGPPNHQNTKAWEDLIQPTFFGATEQELRQGGESVDDAVRLADTDGYLAALGVYHELHCLRQLRLHLYRDTYFPNVTEANLNWFYGHLDHCIETLRISIMCQADLSLYTFKWDSDDEIRPHAKSNAKRQCVNWNQVEHWSTVRKVSLWPRLIRKSGTSDTIHL